MSALAGMVLPTRTRAGDGSTGLPRAATNLETALERQGRKKAPTTRLDGFFRRRNTWLARSLAHLSRQTGAAYSASAAKRVFNVSVSLPAALVVVLLVFLLLVLNKLLYPRHPALFVQDRVGNAERGLRVVKIRSLVARGGVVQSCTALGLLMRRYFLDELPQLYQVLAGQLSMVGIRVLPRAVYDDLAASWSAERFRVWKEAYATASLGLTGFHQVFRRRGKEDSLRFHRDVFYARHASLGFDLYLLWRTLRTTSGEAYGAAARSETRRSGSPWAPVRPVTRPQDLAS